MIFVTHFCHSSSEHPSNQLTCKVWDHHIHLHTPTQIDGQGERGVEMGATGGDTDREKKFKTSVALKQFYKLKY